MGGGVRYGGEWAGRVALVQGAGMLGLVTAAMVRYRGAREVIVCDVDPARLEMAMQFGATQSVLIDPEDDHCYEVVYEVTSGRGAGLVFEMSGTVDAIESGMDLLRLGGKYIWVGSVFPGKPISLNAEKIVRKVITIQGVHNYAPEDLAVALEFLNQNKDRYPFHTLISRIFPLDEAEAAFRYALEEGALRVALQPSK